MKILFKIILIFITVNLSGQNKKAEDLGFRHLQTVYKVDTVDILIKSKDGEDEKAKPIFLFCQGSLPQPLIKYDEQGFYGVFPFNTDSICENYHLAIISKPYIPLISDTHTLGRNYTFVDSLGKTPKGYSDRNLLDYYVKRNIEVLKYLRKQSWVSNSELVVAGHSEGSTIAAKMSMSYSKITNLIYSGGNPMGRIMSVVGEGRQKAQYADTTGSGEEEFAYWEWVVNNKESMDATYGDTGKTTFDFSIPPKEYLEKLKIPVLVCYGTKDPAAPYNDFMRVDFIRKGINNFTFKAYIGTEHNYFPVSKDGEKDYSIYNWDDVANYWLIWLREN